MGKLTVEYGTIHSFKSSFVLRAGFWPLLNSEVFTLVREWKVGKEYPKVLEDSENQLSTEQLHGCKGSV